MLGKSQDPADRWAHAQLAGRHPTRGSLLPDRLTGALQAVWRGKGQLRALLRTGRPEDAAAKAKLEELGKAAGSPHRTGSTAPFAGGGVKSGAGHHRRLPAKGFGQHTAIQNIKRIARSYRKAANYSSLIFLRSVVTTAAGPSFLRSLSPRLGRASKQISHSEALPAPPSQPRRQWPGQSPRF